jgi:hypothetical protein
VQHQHGAGHRAVLIERVPVMETRRMWIRPLQQLWTCCRGKIVAFQDLVELMLALLAGFFVENAEQRVDRQALC